MNLRDLQYLVAVADLRHFGKAAAESHVSQPTLSAQLKKLEDTLGVRLIERGHRQVMMTPVGEEIVARARRILQDSRDIRSVAKAAQDPYAGEVRLGAFPTLAPYLLPLAVPAIHKAFPRLKLLLVEEKTDALLARLKDGTLDAALLALPIDGEGLEALPLFDDPFLLAVPPGHPLAKRKRIRPSDMQGEKLLLLEDGHCLRDQALEVCSLAGATERREFRATSLETLRQMVASGVGITLIPQLAVKKSDGVAYVPFERPPVRSIGLIWRKTSARKPCLQGMAEVIKKLKFPMR